MCARPRGPRLDGVSDQQAALGGRCPPLAPARSTHRARIEIPQFQHLELAELDLGHGVGDVARHELAPAERTLVIEKDAATAEDALSLLGVDGHSVRGPAGR